MNEFSKLISSLVLLGAGFFVASLVGPPEAVRHFADYLTQSGNQPAEPLRPLAADAPALDTQGWPALPVAPSQDQQQATPQASHQPWDVTVAPSVDRASWPAAPSFNDDTSLGETLAAKPVLPTLQAPRFDQPDWDQFGSIDQLPSSEQSMPSQLARPLTPIPRSGAARPPVSQAPASQRFRANQLDSTPPSTTSGWGEAVQNDPQRLAAPIDLSDPAPRTPNAPATLDDSPYGKRPAFQSADLAAPGFAPLPAIERQPTAANYTQHVVADGDTLPRLAELYLGDGSRAGELYELNRDRLESADLLPIGMVLRTPSVPGHLRAAQDKTATDAWPSDAVGQGNSFKPIASTGALVGTSAESDYRTVQRRTDRSLTPVDHDAEPPTTRRQRLGPVDPLFSHEVHWDANRW